MTNANVFDPAMTRRIAQDPAIRNSIATAIQRATPGVHERMVREWATSNEGEFPTWQAARQVAAQEVAILCRALGTLVAIRRFDVDKAFDACSQDYFFYP
ncbi:MAG: hypothetical protein LBR32_07875 [Propionibacteriaceae bacterium]|nr:hypothetical protein [Propionibacteriaceae bacterium]